MRQRLLLALTLAWFPSNAETIRGRIVTDDGMPLVESARVELRCGQSALEFVAIHGDGLFEIDHPREHAECTLTINAPGYRHAMVPTASLPTNPEIPGIALHRLGKSWGESISVSHISAPLEAKRRFHAAIREMRRGEEATVESVLMNLEAAVEVYPGYAQAWFEIGRLRLAQRDPERAVAALRRSVRADPWFVSPYEPLILLLRATGAVEEAASACENLRKVNPALPADCSTE